MNYEDIFEVIQPGNIIFIHIFSLLSIYINSLLCCYPCFCHLLFYITLSTILCVQMGWKSLVLMCNPLSFSYDTAVIVFLPLLHA